jgi:hypothetical protein
MAKILNEQALLEKKVAEQATAIDKLYEGSPELQHKSANSQALKDRQLRVTLDSMSWEGTKQHADVWNSIEEIRSRIMSNANMLPDDWSTMTDLVRLDITRRRMAEPDYTNVVGIEMQMPDAGKSITLDEFLEYGAIMETVYGNNDALPLLEHKSGATGTLTFDLYGVGDKTSLKEVIFSGLYDLERVNRAVSRAYTSLRNDRTVLGRCVAKTTGSTWDATQQVAADTTSGATKEELLYNTIVAAIKKLKGLTDPQTGLAIPATGLCLAVPYGTEWAFMRAIDGQLNAGGKGKVGNYASLMTEVATIIPYRGDVIYAGKKTATYAGVASGKAYLFVPRVANYTVVKRPLTVAVGQGSVLSLEQTERAFYAVDASYDTEFFGDSAGLAAGSGFVVEITLPTL